MLGAAAHSIAGKRENDPLAAITVALDRCRTRIGALRDVGPERLKAEIVAKMLTKSGSAISAARDGAVGSGAALSPIGLTCHAFGISQTCCRYKVKLDAENSVIAVWLVRLRKTAQLRLRSVLPLPAQRQELQMEPQKGLQDLLRARVEIADQAAPSLGA